MPFTPFHFGPGIFIKSIFTKKFSLTVFIITQIVIDTEVLWNLFFGDERLHTFFHTYLGSFVVLIIVFFVVKFAQVLKLFQCPSSIILLSTAIGAWSHVFLDSLMHPDITPWYPWAFQNFMLNQISLSSLHMGCLILGGIGITIWFFARSTQRR